MSNTVNNYTETDLGNISLNPRGEYDNSAAYEYLDTVSYRGGSYFCRAELETTITGIAPDSGHNSEHWQMIAAPGDMTPEYTAAYNDVINKAAQVEISRAAVELAQQEIEADQTDVQQLHSDTVQMAQQAENSKNSAANSAQSAEQSRKTVSESEQNINGQIAGFDSRVSEAVEQAKEEINTTKQQVINTITNQQTASVNTVKTEGEKIITGVGNDAKTVADDRATVEEATQTVLNNAQEVARNTQTVASNAEKAAASAEGAKTSADNAAQSAKSVENASKQIEQNKKDVASLKEDLSNKITKFYASNQGETHLADSDNGKIMDMMLYGRSEQKQYKGINLFPPNTRRGDFIEVSIPKGTKVFAITDGTNFNGGNFRFFNADKTENMWFGIEKDTTVATYELKIDAKYVQNLLEPGLDFSKICLGIGSEPIYEPYIGGIPSPSPDYPQEIKSVVNPVVKVCGKNLWNPIAGGYISNLNGSITASEKSDIATTDFIKTNGKDITVMARNFSLAIEYAFAYRIEFYDAEKKWIKNVVLSDGNKHSINTFNTTDAEYIRVSAPSGVYDTIQIEKGSEATSYEPYTEQSVQLPYTFNAIPVASGGNVTIDGQQYIADRVVEKDGVFGIERNIREIHTNTKTMNNREEYPGWDKVEGISDTIYYNVEPAAEMRRLLYISNFTNSIFAQNNVLDNNVLYFIKGSIGYSQSELIAKAIDVHMYIRLQDAIFEPLPVDIQAKLRTLVTNYPVTNISVTSDQLDGYTVFNYPISMANGWNYVKQQLNDNRDYIYDMDLQSAEAYVNSEYAVALTELEV